MGAPLPPQEQSPMSSTATSTQQAPKPSSWKSRFSLSGRKNSREKQPVTPPTPAETKKEPASSTSDSLSASRRSAREKKGHKKSRFRNLLSSSNNNSNAPTAAGTTAVSEPHNDSTTKPAQPASEPASVPSTTSKMRPSSPLDTTTRTSPGTTAQEQSSPGVNFDSPTTSTNKQRHTKERDGFCRLVDSYDGQVIVVDGKPTYELGNYLGGGVAGVVYEGHRLRPMEEYPVRGGLIADTAEESPVVSLPPPPDTDSNAGSNFLCGEGFLPESEEEVEPPSPPPTTRSSTVAAMDHMAIETTQNQNAQVVLGVDGMDAPSRSHLQVAHKLALQAAHPLTDETVAVKILNPVGFRILPVEDTKGAVVVREGVPMPLDVKEGRSPMREEHVWWCVNPNSRNLRTLQRTSEKVERGTPEKGLRLSMVAAYWDETAQALRELPLTRCIQIWGHVPFSASDMEFEQMMDAIERVNAGQDPLPASLLNSSAPPSRVGTDTTSSVSASSLEEPQQPVDAQSLPAAAPLSPTRTGLFKAASVSRTTVYCQSLRTYLALPTVPPKYLRWLRQRRAATKEIRNMMLIGRHRNVVHLYEVLELIQDSKSTMFLILELVKGGELFDLISSHATSKEDNSADKAANSSELTMRKFFRELASGIHYCHANGIAHRDLKPENLLVHNGTSKQQGTLKIADFGLSATFVITNAGASDDTIGESLHGSLSEIELDRRNSTSVRDGTSSPASPSSPVKSATSSPMKSIAAIGASALSLLHCGSVDDVLCGLGEIEDNPPSPFRRMTSVVGSPHYVAPEIISQHDEGTKSSRRKSKPTGPGYDGTKADVWSAGVILYAMLFRSLPFGEDLLRCPRYQSFSKWYDEARAAGGRRSSAAAALNPVFTDAEEHDMLGPHWFFPSSSSRESRDLIVAMLNPNPNERLSIDMVLQHPWFHSERSSSGPGFI